MLGDNDFCHTVQVVPFFIRVDFIVFRAVDKAYHIGILLNSSGFTEVTELGTFSVNTLTTFHTTVQLAQCDDGGCSVLWLTPFSERENGTDLFLTGYRNDIPAGIH